MKADISVCAGIWLTWPGMGTFGFANITGLNNPDAAEIGPKDINNAVCYLLQFVGEISFHQQTLVQAAQPFNPLLGLNPACYILGCGNQQ